MKLRVHFSILLLFFSLQISFGQMIIGGDTLVGNEWIRYDQRYYKFSVELDGVYRIPVAVLQAAGIEAAEISGNSFRLYNMGQQVPLFVSKDGLFGAGDFIEFFGHKNRSELDQHLYRNPSQDMLNPDHSLYTDRNVYFLTTDGTDTPLRVNRINGDQPSPPAPATFFLHKETLAYNSQFVDHYHPVSGGGTVSYSSYMHTEGFGKPSENNTVAQVPVTESYLIGPDATLRVRMASSNYGAHSYEVSFNNQVLGTITLNDLQIRDQTFAIPVNLLTSDNQVKLTAASVSSRHTVALIELQYARHPIMSNATAASIILPGQTGDQHYILNGFQHQGSKPVIYSYDGVNRMEASLDGSGNIDFTWPETTSDLRLEIRNSTNGILEIQQLQPLTFTDFTNDDTEYIVITHPALMEAGTASDYLQYRISPTGGGYKGKAYSILDIYDQFGYGIEKHPQAIRNFVTFFDQAWPSAEMIYIIGRAIEYNFSRYPGAWEESFFVPTFGRPGSDNLLTATLTDLVPRFPIGRLAVTNRQQITQYLNKVKEHDQVRFADQTIAAKGWVKNIMHIGGGKTASEQNDFKTVLASLADIIEDSKFGAKVSFFQKQSTDIIGESQSKQIERLLNEGNSIINYLGHSSTSTFEFNINDPAEWNNKGRYPVFSAMGCSAGQIHGTVLSLSDRYVLLPDEGSIAFISGSGSQFASALIKWARPWYEFIGGPGYDRTLGESILTGLIEVGDFVNPEMTNSNQYRYLLEQQTFQGDPALKFHYFDGPDYLVDKTSVSISPEILNTKLDSFDVTFSVANLGVNLNQHVNYTILIKHPGGQQTTIHEGTILASSYLTTTTVRLPLDTDGKPGSFRLLIHLDPDQLIAELPAPPAEQNNILTDNLGIEGIPFVVLDYVLSAAYPPDFAIVNDVLPQMIATSSNSFVKPQDIILQIDTTIQFNSPSLYSERFIDHPASIKWSPVISYTPGQVYFWRVSLDSISPEQGYVWSRRSFLYDPSSPNGWNQSHFHQLTDDALQQITPDSAFQKFDFLSRGLNYSIVNRVQNNALGLFPQMKVDNVIRNAYFAGFGAQNINVFVVVIDSVTGMPMLNPNPGLYGSVNHLSFDAPAFAYNSTDPASRQAMINFIDNIVPAGSYVFFYTYQRPGNMDYMPEQWAADEGTFGKSIFSTIENYFPTSTIRTLEEKGSVPYIAFFQKGTGGIQEFIANDLDEVISMSWDAPVSLSIGKYTSTLIGPASSWASIDWQIEDESVSADHLRLSAWALSSDLSDTLWISHHLQNPDTTIAGIDAKAYPYMQLALRTVDSVSYSPAEILYWRVLFEGYPEVIINTGIGFVFEADSLERGDNLRLHTYIENVSDYAIDSLPVSLKIISADNTTKELRQTITQIPAHTASPVNFEHSTIEFSGDYTILFDINADRHVAEYNYDNNIGILSMFVRDDELNPVLDVTFDGKHILDGDLVASRPLIAIRLHDENQHLRLDDTSLFAVFLEFPSDITPRQISFSEDWVNFQQAPGTGQNIATLELRPDLLEDGIYLLSVRAKDAAGNAAGDHDYSISFEVITAESVSHLYNYPNPFNNATRFVYTLTGASSPAYYKIQIMSLSGRIVREITQQELGPLHVGTHMTDFVWDGTDESGGQLAAGTYLYRMIVKNHDQDDYDRYNTSGDSFFRKGWGKLVILR